MEKIKIRKKEITQLRIKARPSVEEDLQNLLDSKDQQEKGPYPRLQFVNKFFLYSGLCKFYEEKEVEWKTIEDFEKEVMQMFNCDSDWPICLFDFTYKNRIPNYLCFKTQSNFSNLFQENYFDFSKEDS